jgi:hypothetical protein
MPNWLRKPKIAKRYDCSPRNIERMWNDGRLPPPQFPFGNDIPANSEEELDAWDREAVKRGVDKRAAVLAGRRKRAAAATSARTARRRHAANAAAETASPEIDPQES